VTVAEEMIQGALTAGIVTEKKAPVKPRSGEKRTGGKSSKPRSYNHQ